MKTYEITAEMNLKKIISESREVAQVLNEFADRLERIEKKYAEPQAEKALSQKPCDDLISREETLTAFADYVGSGMSMNDYDALWNIVEKMPPARPQKTASKKSLQTNSVECSK